MKIHPVLKKCMVPFLREYGFELTDKGGGVYTFSSLSNPKQFVRFTIGTVERGICPQVNDGLGRSIALVLFLFDPSDMVDAADHFWQYDTENELIGSLEAQAVLLEQKGFAWIRGELGLDVRAIMIENTGRIASATQEEKEAFIEKWTEWNENWRRRRFFPQNWLL